MKYKDKILNMVVCIFCLLFYISCNQSNRKNNQSVMQNNLDSSIIYPKDGEKDMTVEVLTKEYPYDYETTLSNGYNLEFSYFKGEFSPTTEMCLSLKKGNKLIDTLNTMGWAASFKNLGYIGGDFNDYFVFVNSFGSGNPHEMRLIRKSDGKTIQSGFLVDTYKKPELLLYAKDYDSLMLYYIAKKKDIYIENLNESKVIKLTASQFCDGVKIIKANKVAKQNPIET